MALARGEAPQRTCPGPCCPAPWSEFRPSSHPPVLPDRPDRAEKPKIQAIRLTTPAHLPGPLFIYMKFGVLHSKRALPIPFSNSPCVAARRGRGGAPPPSRVPTQGRPYTHLFLRASQLCGIEAPSNPCDSPGHAPPPAPGEAPWCPPPSGKTWHPGSTGQPGIHRSSHRPHVFARRRWTPS